MSLFFSACSTTSLTEALTNVSTRVSTNISTHPLFNAVTRDLTKTSSNDVNKYPYSRKATYMKEHNKAQLKNHVDSYYTEVNKLTRPIIDFLLSKNYSKNYYEKLLQVCRKNHWSSCRGTIPSCYVSNGIKRCPSEEISLDIFEDFQLPLLRARAKSSGGVVTEYPLKFSQDWYKKSTVVLKNLLNKFPKIKHRFNSIKDLKYKNRFENYIYLQENEKARIIVLKEFSNVLMNK